MKSADIIALDKKHVWHHLTQHKVYEDKDPAFIVEGKGARVKDLHGKEYLDCVSGGVWTVNVGYGREKIVKAMSEEILKMNYFSNAFGSIPAVKFAEKLIDKMPGMSRVYFSNSGSEANEKAFKIIRQISQIKHGGKKYKIVYRERDYHGTTITTLSACGQPERQMQYGPFTPGFVEFPACSSYRSPYSDNTNLGEKFARELEKVVQKEDPDTVGGVILEPITAGGGVIVPPEGYFETISEICKKYGLLLIIDEVVCGIGRTGKWFGYQHFNVQPDIVTMAKGVASGYAPISCTVTTEEVFSAFLADPSDRDKYFRDISTFGGCTAGPAAALANMEIIEEENLIENVNNMGEYLLGRLNELQDKHKVIGEVRGKGLFCGLELVKDRITKEPVEEAQAGQVVAECMKQGVLIGKTTRSFRDLNNTICLAPPYIVNKSDMDQLVGALDKALTTVFA